MTSLRAGERLKGGFEPVEPFGAVAEREPADLSARSTTQARRHEAPLDAARRRAREHRRAARRAGAGLGNDHRRRAAIVPARRRARRHGRRAGGNASRFARLGGEHERRLP